MVYTPGLWLFILSALITTGVIGYSWRYRATETGKAFLALMFCSLVWVVFFCFETASTSLAGKLFWANVQFLGITFLPTIWVFLVLAFTGARVPRWMEIALLALPATTNLVIWTNPLHHWFIGSPQIEYTLAPFPVLEQDYRFWFYFVHAPLNYVILLAAIFLLVKAMGRMQGVYRTQARLLLFSILLPAITDVLYVLGYSPVRYYNYTTAVFSFSGVILAWALFRYQFLDLLPLARDTVIEQLNDLVLIFDHKIRLSEVNPAAREIFGLARDVVGKTAAETGSRELIQISDLIQLGVSHKDVRLVAQPTRTFDLRIQPVIKQGGLMIGWVVTARDISERVEFQNRLQELATRDDLTGIYNRRYFLELCQREMYRIQRLKDYSVAVVMIDLDHFKQINDLYGHASGDRALVSFANAIQAELRVMDVFGRMGGEEFAVLLVDVDDRAARVVVERLRAGIEALRIAVEGKEINITASFGLALPCGREGQEFRLEELLVEADQAMYQAKQAGRNCVIVAECADPPDAVL